MNTFDNPVWFRYDEVRYASMTDEFDNPVGSSRVSVELTQYTVDHETPKGVWLRVGFSTKFCRKDARKRFACPTQEEAMASFIARKQRQLRILEAQANDVRQALVLVGVVTVSPSKTIFSLRQEEFT